MMESFLTAAVEVGSWLCWGASHMPGRRTVPLFVWDKAPLPHTFQEHFLQSGKLYFVIQ